MGIYPMASVATSIVFEGRIEVPPAVHSLADFRRWAASEEFPETGRIDFIEGKIEVDMAPEDLFCHGSVKTEIARGLSNRVKDLRLGHLFIDRGRVSAPHAGLSVEPDIVFISRRTLASGRARLTPKAGHGRGRYIEIEGAADLVVEIVSDSSVTKDTRQLPAAYFKAGMSEFWLVDARGDEPVFLIHRAGPSGFEPVVRDAEGFQHSDVFGCRFRLDATRDADGNWEFDLREEE
jgi:Uma2 family endonuclease